MSASTESPGATIGSADRGAIRPTPRAALVLAAGIPPGFLLLTWNASLWILPVAYALFALAAIGIDAAMTRRPRRVGIEAFAPERLYVGRSGTLVLDIDAGGRPEPIRFEALCELVGDAPQPQPAAGVSAAGRLTLEIELLARRRGRLELAAVWARWRGPMGLAEGRKRVAIGRSIDVVPDIRGIQSAALQFFDRDSIFGAKVQRQKGEGAEFETLREYAPGLDHRFMDWKRSAKHRKLLTREFRTERNNPVMLAFDTGHLMLEPIDGVARLDHAIEAGLLLGWISLRGGDLVGAYGFDARARQFLAPAGGMPHFARLQRAGAGLAYRTEETNFTLGLAELEARLNRRTLVVLFTEFVDTISAELLLESLTRMARRHVVVFVTLQDPMAARLIAAAPERFSAVAQAVVAHDFQRERSIVLERIARLGVHCLDAPARHVSAGLLNRYLAIKQRGLM